MTASRADEHLLHHEPRPDELRASCVQGFDAFLGLEPDWRALLKRASPGNPFLSWEWVSEWGRAFWDDQVITVLVYLGSHAVAIAPFFRGPSVPVPGLGATHLQLLGPRWGRNLLEMGSVLLDPAHAAEALTLAIEWLRVTADFDWIEVAASGDDIATWQQALERCRLRSRTLLEIATQVPVMPLGGAWEQMRPRLRRNIKESIRHAYNAPVRDGVVYAYREHRGAEGLDVVLDHFFRLHRERAAAPDCTPHGDLFSAPANQLFLRRVCLRLAEAGLLSVSMCEVEGDCVAVRINFEMNGTLYLYYSGFDPEWSGYSVMTFTTTEAIKSAMRRRLREVNFSPGVDQAKRRWDVTLIPLTRFSIIVDRRRSRARFALYRRLRRVSKWQRTARSTIFNGRRAATRRFAQRARRPRARLGSTFL